LYQVEPILDEKQLEIPFDTDKKHSVVKFELDNAIIVTVPSSMTHGAVNQLQECFPEEWKDRNILVITDNIKFLRCKRIRQKDFKKMYNHD
jgi:hypothetical protein